jgi:hypothetical protein
MSATRRYVRDSGLYAAAVPRSIRIVVIVVLAGAALIAGCGSKSTPAATSTSTVPTSAGPGGHVAIPVSKDPSKSAKMLCEDDVRREVQALVGVAIAKPLAPTWKDHVYSCRYVYSNGAMTLSVKELANTADTDAYFAAQATALGKQKTIQGLGQGAFTTKNGSTVVRKDYKVLLVDVSGLPAQFGTPPDTKGNVALNVAAEIMGCWTGA